MNNNERNGKSKAVVEDNGGGEEFTQELRDIAEASLAVASLKHTVFDKETLSELERLKCKFGCVPKDGEISNPPSCKRPRSRRPRTRIAQELVNNKNHPPQVQVNQIPDTNYTPEQIECLGGAKDSQKPSPSSSQELVKPENHPPQLHEVQIIQVSAVHFPPEKSKFLGGAMDSQKSSPNYKPPGSRFQAQPLVKPKNLPLQLHEVSQATGLHYTPEQSKFLVGAKDGHKSSASINRPGSGSQADQELVKIDNHPPQAGESSG